MNLEITPSLCRFGLLAAFLASGNVGADSNSLLPDAKIQVGTGRVAITFDNSRRFFLTDKTAITQRGVPVDAEVLIQVGTGRRARFLVADDVNDAFTSGTLTAIEFGAQIEGPVTSTNPLAVFNYELDVTSDTTLTNLPGDDIANIEVGAELLLAGFSDSQGGFQVTGLEFEDDPLDEWVVTGPVSNISGEGFFIGSQAVAFNGVDPEGCLNGFTAGVFVQVEALPAEEFERGDTITTTSEIECLSDELGGEPGAIVPAYVEGFITVVSANSGFFVGEQSVVVTPETLFESGDAADLEVGLLVHVEGLLNTDTGVLDAEEVEFARVRVEAEAPLSAADIIGDTITILGIPMRSTQETEDEDNILGGIVGTIQVRMEGFVDSEGLVVLDSVENSGPADANDVSLRAVVDAIDQPEVTVLGVTVDTSLSDLFLDDESPTPLTEGEFFEALRVGSEISIDGASYNGTENTLSGGEIEIELESDGGPEDKRHLASKGMNSFGVGIGVIVESGDAVFSSGFE